MRGGWIGTLGVVGLLLFAAVSRGAEESIFVDGFPVDLMSPVREGETGLLVALYEFAPLVGIEVAETSTDLVELRWRGGRMQLETRGLPTFGGLVYTSLDWVVSLAGGVARELGESVFIESEPVELRELEVSEAHVVARFGDFVPIEIVSVDGSSFRLRFDHCQLPFSQRSFVLADGPMSRVDAQMSSPSGLEISVSLREIGALRLTRLEANDAFAVTIEVTEEPVSESVILIAADRELHELETETAAGQTSIAYVYVEGWRSAYRVRPAGSATDLGELAPLVQMALASSAEIAVGAGSSVDLLVIDGVPYNLPAEETPLLLCDAFGRLSSSTGVGQAVLKVEGAQIPLDNVNRRLRYGEAIGYPPGYRGEIGSGTTGGFTVLKIRSGCVVSIYQGSFVDPDPTATLVVASGEARSRLSGVSLGDDARLLCKIDGLSEPPDHAITIDSTLLRNGVPLLDDDDSETSCAWSVIATDWHGGLIALSIPQSEWSAGATRTELLALLQDFDVPVKDAFVLDAGDASAFVVSDRGFQDLGDVDRVAIAVVLVPIDE